MRAALSALTTRGRSFLAAGVAACACGLFLGEIDLLRVGVLLCALPLVTAAVVARTRYRLSCTRRIEPSRVPVGETAQVALQLQNLARVPTGVLLLEDRLPYSLGGRPRYVVSRVEPRGVREVRHPVRSDLRGRYLVGPLSLRFADLFGLVELTRSFTSVDALMVTPSVVDLPRIRLGGGWTGGGDSQARSISTTGEDDVTTREYRHGDDLRRVHWRSTARYGELMVRREEQPWQHRAVLLLDTRAGAHRGDGPGASFEWAVSAAASVGVHLLRQGFGLRFVTHTGAELSGYGTDTTDAIAGTPFEGLLLDSLALVATTSGTDVGTGLSAIRRGGGEGLVVAVLGRLDDTDLDALAAFRHHASACVAIVLDTLSWTAGPASFDSTEFDRSCNVLVAAGWRVLPARAGTDLRQVWRLAAAGAVTSTAPFAGAPTPAGAPAGTPAVTGGVPA